MITLEQVRKVRDHFLTGNRCRGVMVSGIWPVKNEDRDRIFDGACCLVGGFCGADPNHELNFGGSRKAEEVNEYLRRYLKQYRPDFVDKPDRKFKHHSEALAYSFNDYYADDAPIIDFLNWLERELSNGST